MFSPSALLLSTAFLFAVVSAKPIAVPRAPNVALPINRNLNLGGLTLPEVDRARVAALQANRRLGKRVLDSVAATNNGVSYTADVGVGFPPQTYKLLIDTGSSNTWVGANTPYTPSETSQDTGDTVQVKYGSGSFSGEEYNDRVTLSPELVIEKQSIGVANKSEGLAGIDGILGLGPVDLTAGTLDGKPGTTIPTVTDNLFSQGTIPENVFAVSFEPITQAGTQNGEITFGGTDSSKFTGDVSFVPITSTSPSSDFWGVDESIRYDGASILSSTAGIVDTGSTLVLLATDAFNNYQKATGGVLDKDTNLLKITQDQFANLKDLDFLIGGVTYTMTPNAQIWPRSLNSDIGGTSDGIYLIVSDLGTPSGQGMDFVNGYAFLERFYTVYDAGNNQVGFATTPHTDATLN